MAGEIVYVTASMALLAVVTVDVARSVLGVPLTWCLAAVGPMIVVGSVSVAWVVAALGLHIFAVPAGVGVVVLLLGGVTAALA